VRDARAISWLGPRRQLWHREWPHSVRKHMATPPCSGAWAAAVFVVVVIPGWGGAECLDFLVLVLILAGLGVSATVIIVEIVGLVGLVGQIRLVGLVVVLIPCPGRRIRSAIVVVAVAAIVKGKRS